MRSVSRDALGLFIAGVGGLAFLAGFFNFITLLPTYGWLAALVLIIGALLFIVAEWRQNRSLLSALLQLILIGGLVFATMFGLMWYITSYMPAHGGLDISFETANTVRNDFMSDLKIGKFDKAYELLSPDAKNQIPDSATLGKVVTENNWQPTQWKWTTEQVDSEHAEFDGDATYISKKDGKLQLWLDKIDKHWKVSGMNFQPQ